MAVKSVAANLASALELEAARLAGVSEILLEIGMGSDRANSIGVLRDIVDAANGKISEIAATLRRRHG